MALVSFTVGQDALKLDRDYDRRTLRKELRKVGSDVRKLARKMVSKRTVSAPGEPPGRVTGTLRRSIKSKVSRSGHSVSIYPDKTPAMGGDFYPAFVVYGHRGPGTETAKQAISHRKRPGKKVAEPRANYVVEAGGQYEKKFRRLMEQVVAEAILPGYLR